MLGTGALAFGTGRLGAEDTVSLRAAIIGQTGRGDYGHGLDVVFNDVPGVQVVAVADPVARGCATAAKRSGALRQYADYREMLDPKNPGSSRSRRAGASTTTRWAWRRCGRARTSTWKNRSPRLLRKRTS